jgi:hypothetical protein
MDAGYTGEGNGADWAERVLGWTAQIVRHPPELSSEEVMKRWVEEWAIRGCCDRSGGSLGSSEVWGPASVVGG